MPKEEVKPFPDIEAGSGDGRCSSDTDAEDSYSSSSCSSQHHIASHSEINVSPEHRLKPSLSDWESSADAEKGEIDCRICHLSLGDKSSSPIALGCSCKDDLAAAHRQCAETWFKIKGNKTCEICGSTAKNVAFGSADIQQWNEAAAAAAAAAASATETTPSSPTPPSEERRRFWQGRRFVNVVLASVVFAFVVSWLFHFNVPN